MKMTQKATNSPQTAHCAHCADILLEIVVECIYLIFEFYLDYTVI